MRGLCRISLLLVMLAHSGVRAETFTYNFAGHITELILLHEMAEEEAVSVSDLAGATLRVGDKYTGTFTYDSDAPATRYGLSTTSYAGALKSLSLNFSSSGLNYQVSAGSVSVHASEYLYQFSLGAQNSPYWSSFYLYDLSAGHELSRDLPRGLSSFLDRPDITFGSYLGFNAPDGDALWIGNSVDSISAVDEPSAAAMMIAGFGLLGLIARRRRQRACVLMV